MSFLGVNCVKFYFNKAKGLAFYLFLLEVNNILQYTPCDTWDP